MAPVGHASWHGAFTQCLHTSLIISQRPGPLSGNCSMNFTCRHDCADSAPVLSWLLPVHSRPSAGSWFHCLHATSHALQPMQTVVSVKKPVSALAGGGVAFSMPRMS